MPLSTIEPHLLSPREFLTSLFNSLPQELAVHGPGLPNNSRAGTASNPLKVLGATHRSLLITLHVLFPSLFLQALDLLDRGLVTRVLQVVPSSSLPTDNQPQAQIHFSAPAATESHLGDFLSESRDQALNQNTIYLVRSAQTSYINSRSGSSSSNRFGNTPMQGLSYVVRLQAWNCSCAAFAFSAFPGATSAPFSPAFEADTPEVVSPQVELGAEVEYGVQRAWQFGALSLDGTRKDQDALPVPCCKHLMACLLVERWKTVLGTFVKEMRVGQEEMAGLGVE